MKAPNLIAFFVLASLQWQCDRHQSDALAHISDQKARSIVEGALNKTGGLGAWQAIAKIEFEKKTTLFDQAGNTEFTSDQQHRYFYHPSQVIDIHWQDSLGYHQVIKKEDTVSKLLNNQIEVTDEKKLLDLVLSAEYVVMLPFKLANEKMELIYEGIDTLEGQQEVHTIRAHYDPMNPDSINTTDVWWHYFDVGNLMHAGYKVKHADHTSLIRNTSHISHLGFVFPEKRRSFRIDTHGRIEYLRAEYTYSNYLVNQ
jgi:hypothetical protein